MSATRGQRIGIWTIAIIMAVGTIGSFIVIILAQQNQGIDQAAQEKSYAEQLAAYEKEQLEASKKNAANSEPLNGYSAAKFDAKAAKSLKKEVLVAGTGAEVKKTDTINASYFGWTSNGKIFDSSNKKDADDKGVTFSLQEVISGWTEGLAGQRVGSTVKLTIPASQAYGAAGSGVIPANAPLQFIVQIHSMGSAAL